jgi:hypothetical protein
MRQFSSPGFRLWNLGREAKVLYTAFCLLTVVGMASSALYYLDLGGGAGLGGVRRYYAGEAPPDARPAPAPPTGDGGGHAPRIEVPDENVDPGTPLVLPVTTRKLLEVTHFHLFTMPVVLLILGHLFFATGLSDRTKLLWVVAASLAVALHLGTPWLVRFAGGAWAVLHAVSGTVLVATMTVLALYPMIVMWRPRRRAADQA